MRVYNDEQNTKSLLSNNTPNFKKSLQIVHLKASLYYDIANF